MLELIDKNLKLLGVLRMELANEVGVTPTTMTHWLQGCSGNLRTAQFEKILDISRYEGNLRERLFWEGVNNVSSELTEAELVSNIISSEPGDFKSSTRGIYVAKLIMYLRSTGKLNWKAKDIDVICAVTKVFAKCGYKLPIRSYEYGLVSEVTYRFIKDLCLLDFKERV